MPAIEIAGLIKAFGANYALRDINLSVTQGSFLVIFGPNGAGKTTLIKTLSTLSKPSAGDISIAGKSLFQTPEAIRRQIGVIGHQTFLYEDLTAEENLRFYAKLYDLVDPGPRISELLEEVGLNMRRRERVRNFSRGMQQRLSIARAMLHSPRFLFLDEPYTGLDQHASAMLSGWLRRLKSEDRTILLVTHDLEQGLGLADRVAVLVNGRIVFDKSKQDIELSTFKSLYNELVAGDRQ